MPTIYNRQGVFIQSVSIQNHQPDKMLFPLLYHVHHKTFQSDIPFWLDLARRQGSPVLELGCGTGRVLIPLADAGYNVYGLDNDNDMLTFCRQRVSPRIQENVNLILADFTSFDIEIQFPLILMPCNTFSTLRESSRKSALASISKHLHPGGVFAVSVPNPAVLSRLETSEIPEMDMSFPHPATGNPVQVSYSTKRTDQNILLEWYYDQLLPNGHVNRLKISTLHWLTTKAEYLQEFTQSGYAIINTYGDFDYSPLKVDSPNLIIVAKKK